MKFKHWLIISLLFITGISFLFLFRLDIYLYFFDYFKSNETLHYEYTEKEFEKLAKIDNALSASKLDTTEVRFFREIGNTVFLDSMNKYIMFVSGYKKKYVKEMREIYIYAAYSNDGLIFDSIKRIVDIEGEDPYAIVKDKKVHVFFENAYPTNDKIVHVSSIDGYNYKLEAPTELSIKKNTFYSDNIGNPLVFFDSTLSTYIMLFEGMNFKNKHIGKVGIAFSNDLKNWNIRSNFIEISNRKKWMIDNTIRYGTKIIDGVDDTFLIGDERYITIHCYDQIRGYVSTILSFKAKSTKNISLKNIMEKPLSISSTLMVSRINDKLYFRFNENQNIVNAIPVKAIKMPEVTLKNIGITWEQQ